MRTSGSHTLHNVTDVGSSMWNVLQLKYKLKIMIQVFWDVTMCQMVIAML